MERAVTGDSVIVDTLTFVCLENYIDRHTGLAVCNERQSVLARGVARPHTIGFEPKAVLAGPFGLLAALTAGFWLRAVGQDALRCVIDVPVGGEAEEHLMHGLQSKTHGDVGVGVVGVAVGVVHGALGD